MRYYNKPLYLFASRAYFLLDSDREALLCDDVEDVRHKTLAKTARKLNSWTNKKKKNICQWDAENEVVTLEP